MNQTIKRNKDEGYLRSRWGYPFGIEIHEIKRGGKWGETIFEHKDVDMAEDNPPLKSIRIIDRQFKKMQRRKLA